MNSDFYVCFIVTNSDRSENLLLLLVVLLITAVNISTAESITSEFAGVAFVISYLILSFIIHVQLVTHEHNHHNPRNFCRNYFPFNSFERHRFNKKYFYIFLQTASN